ncbi:chorismate synthase [Streptomyces tagetis]|uniref:chorismate synthase n=1 Tax=Streptomyces tagetis TaxID=2820809 RepID=A0A941B0C7_9ACTN|nr:chorismate synthase [Streptomyces sp. RG38]MBQ0827185.1 chorismate synthase [Streptomyces sp. RG38]
MSFLRRLTAGESHGRALTPVLAEGLPAGVRACVRQIAFACRRGHGHGTRMTCERDGAAFTGGVRHGPTPAGPVAARVGDSPWPTGQTVTAAGPVFADALAHTARAALGTPGPHHSPTPDPPAPKDTEHLDPGPVRCPDPADPADPAASAVRGAESDRARRAGDTLGAVAEVIACHVPPGPGSHVHRGRRLDACPAGALMGTRAVEGVESGEARRRQRPGDHPQQPPWLPVPPGRHRSRTRPRAGT